MNRRACPCRAQVSWRGRPAAIPPTSLQSLTDHPHQHSHVVARSQIDLFAVDRKVHCHFADGRPQVIGTRNVGVRKNIYSVKQPDGTLSTGFERAINPVERNGIVVLREIDERWPPTDADRRTLCEYLGLQAVRSPAYRLFFEQRRDAALDERLAGLDTTRRLEVEQIVRSDEFRIANTGGQVAKTRRSATRPSSIGSIAPTSAPPAPAAP